MSSVMNYSVWSVKNLSKIPLFKSHFKCASTRVKKHQVQDEKELPQPERRSRKKVLFSPNLPREKLEKIGSITSVVVGLNLVSWAKISVSSVKVLDWDAYSLPYDFLENVTETDIVEAAHTVKAKIPDSELYVMETVPYMWSRYSNYISLRSMLILLLSSLSDGVKNYNIVFQKSSVLNAVHNLTVGGERSSAKGVLEKKCSLIFSENIVTKAQTTEEKANCYSLLDIQNSQLHCFPDYSVEKQEDLSVALLLALTFLDIAVSQNPESLSKINKKHYLKTLHC